MLEVIEQYLGRIRSARTDSELAALLGDISGRFGLRSGYLLEYSEGMKTAKHVLDSRAERVPWWYEYIANGIRTSRTSANDLLSQGGVQIFQIERFEGPDDPMMKVARKYDILECVLVPISFNGVVVGLVGFSGKPELTEMQKSTLQILCYTLFAQARSLHTEGIHTAPESLTPREKEVMQLSAEGFTSQDIAEKLGMSARTVNQHVDNVAVKLGTKNRAHTVAEVIRHNLLG
ncbi:MAG: helix-turn-helix transcriptional regulator [Devosia sp.]